VDSIDTWLADSPEQFSSRSNSIDSLARTERETHLTLFLIVFFSSIHPSSKTAKTESHFQKDFGNLKSKIEGFELHIFLTYNK
jgi:hypothetical protein